MTAAADFRRCLADCPLVAILRGVRPDEAEAIGEALVDGGIRIVEVPLNSPDPLASIERLAKRIGDRALVGAGTVLAAERVGEVASAGGRLIVAPNFQSAVVEAAVAAGLAAMPGVFTPTEAFAAIAAGADALKFFPAEAGSPAVVKSLRSVLPRDLPLIVFGGVKAESMPGWFAAGADGFGVGSALYSPGQSASATATKAQALAAAARVRA